MDALVGDGCKPSSTGDRAFVNALVRDPCSPEAVFLVGCHRSGTTLLRYLLDSHPNIACPPESKFIAGIEAFLGYPQALDGLGHLGISLERVRDELRAIIAGVFDEYAAREGKRRWVDKTPNYFRLLPLIDWLFMGEVLYLFIVRHPFDTIDSLENARCFAAKRLVDPDVAAAVERHGRSRAGWAHYWCDVNECMLSFAAAHESQCFSCRYEDLVSAPEIVLTDMLGFMGETLPPQLVETAFTTPHKFGYADWKIREATNVHRTSVNKWTEWSADEIAALWDIVGPLAETLGYARPDSAVLAFRSQGACP
jgi:protein-tyrosine sulfotransferase